MTYSAMPPLSGDFRIARVLGRSFELLSRDFVRFYLIAAIISLPLLAFRIYGPRYLAAIPLFLFGYGPAIRTALTVLIGGAAVSFVVAVLGQAVILYGTVQQMRGRSFGIGESLGRGLARLVPILLMLVLFFFAVALPALALIAATNLFGSPLLFVLGALATVVLFCMLSARWYVSLPACVIEREGPAASLGRSAFLTRGYRWKIFGMYLLLLVASVVAERAFVAVLFSVFGALPASFGLFLLQSLISAYQAIVVAVAYHDLRVAKEGIDIEHVAAVFD